MGLAGHGHSPVLRVTLTIIIRCHGQGKLHLSGEVIEKKENGYPRQDRTGTCLTPMSRPTVRSRNVCPIA